MGLNLNTPQTKNYTGLNPVRSGATAEPDYSVKYTPQELTEAQQAQARQNIGAISESEIPAQVQADWSTIDSTMPSYIKNKPESLGGNAAELDTYWTVYPKGDTTISLHAGTINKVWMNGEEVEAISDVYSVNAFSVVRIDASANASFIFSNTTDPIWLWSPGDVTVNEPVYGTRYNVNLVNRAGGGSNLNFGGRIWLLNNIITPSMFTMTTENTVTKAPRIYLNDSPVDFSAITEEPDLSQSPVFFYVHSQRWNEFRDANFHVSNDFYNNIRPHLVKYESLVQEDFTFRFILTSNPENAYSYLKIDNPEYFGLLSYNNWDGTRCCVGIYKDGQFIDPEHFPGKYNDAEVGRTPNVSQEIQLGYSTIAIFNKYDDTDEIMIGPLRPPYSDVTACIYAKNIYANQLINKIYGGNTWNTQTTQVTFAGKYSNLYSFGYNLTATLFVYVENNRISDGRYYLTTDNKIVFTNQSMSEVSKGSSSDAPITQASDVLATIYCPRSRYDELVARYETLYADEIAGGTIQLSWITDHIVKYDYIENINYRKAIVSFDAVPLTMTDANGDTIDGDFLAQNVTITPAV